MITPGLRTGAAALVAAALLALAPPAAAGTGTGTGSGTPAVTVAVEAGSPGGPHTAAVSLGALAETTAAPVDPQVPAAVSALQDQQVWVAPGADGLVDATAVADAVAADRTDIVVAVLAPLAGGTARTAPSAAGSGPAAAPTAPAGSTVGSAAAVAPAVGAAVAPAAAVTVEDGAAGAAAEQVRVDLASDNLFVLVVVPDDLTVAGARPDAVALARAVRSTADLSTRRGRTAAVVKLVGGLQALERGDRVPALTPRPSTGTSPGTVAALILVGLLVAAVLVAGVLVTRRQNRAQADLADEVVRLQAQLAGELDDLDPGDDPQARAALDAAAHALDRCCALLAGGEVPADLPAARAAALDGLAATGSLRRLTSADPS